MIYTNSDKSKLPTINELVDILKGHTGSLPIKHLMPYDHPISGDDLFLLNRTATGLFSLKPNITNQSCLFYGLPFVGEPVVPSFWKLNPSQYMVQNVLREEFEIVMESHPLYGLLKGGIPTKYGLFRIFNPYGIASAYGFPSPMLNFTSSIEIAAFFATHERDKVSGVWMPLPAKDQKGNSQCGTLFFMYLAYPFPTLAGLSSIGYQAFKRTGLQRLFGFQMPRGADLRTNKLVSGFEFRQDPESAKKIAQQFDNGNLLTPNELLAKKADKILCEKFVSVKAFKRNCQLNPTDDHNKNKMVLIRSGVTIEPCSRHLFTSNELNEEFYSSVKDEWDIMCQHLVAVRPGFDKIIEELKGIDILNMLKH